jgi:hypothetical protein
VRFIAFIIGLLFTINAHAQTTVWGFTSDNVRDDTTLQVAALSSLPGTRNTKMLRVIFNPKGVDLRNGGQNTLEDFELQAQSYLPAVKALSEVATVLGCVYDSVTLSDTRLAEIELRTQAYVKVLGAYVKVWEVGNEINGDWLVGEFESPIVKVRAIHNIVTKRGHETALCFFFGRNFIEEFQIIPWVNKNIPPGDSLRSNTDYVLLSYYDNEANNGPVSNVDCDPVFQDLKAAFPNAKVGFGECGWPSHAKTPRRPLVTFAGEPGFTIARPNLEVPDKAACPLPIRIVRDPGHILPITITMDHSDLPGVTADPVIALEADAMVNMYLDLPVPTVLPRTFTLTWKATDGVLTHLGIVRITIKKGALPPTETIPKDAKEREALIRRFYEYQPLVKITDWIGGGFYWHFNKTMIEGNPYGTADIDLFKQLMSRQSLSK